MNGMRIGLFLGLVIACGFLFSLGASSQVKAIAEQPSDFVVDGTDYFKADPPGSQTIITERSYNGPAKLVNADGSVSQKFTCVGGICVPEASIQPSSAVKSTRTVRVCENGVCRTIEVPIEEGEVFFPSSSVVQYGTVQSAPVRNRVFRPLARLRGIFSCRR